MKLVVRGDDEHVRTAGQRFTYDAYQTLGDGALASFRQQQARERRVLSLIEGRCAFRAPRVLQTSKAGWDLRDPVAGVVDPPALYHRATGRAWPQAWW